MALECDDLKIFHVLMRRSKSSTWLVLIVLFFLRLGFFPLGFPLQGFNKTILRHLKVHKNIVLFFLCHSFFFFSLGFSLTRFLRGIFLVHGHPRASVVKYLLACRVTLHYLVVVALRIGSKYPGIGTYV